MTLFDFAVPALALAFAGVAILAARASARRLDAQKERPPAE